jgi:putative lipoprotein
LSLSKPARADEWFGKDKSLHFGVSAGLAVGGYAASALVLDEPWQRSVAGTGFALTFGVAKETWDAAGHGDPSWKDLTWDVAGTAVGVGLALAVDLLLFHDSAESQRQARAPLVIRW